MTDTPTTIALVHRLQTWLTRPRLLFFFSAFLIAQVGLFFYLESRPGMLDRTDKVRGKDFFILYLASYLVHHGQADKLYDQEFFIATEGTFVEFTDIVPRNPSVYPPHAALLLAPLGALPYDYAVIIWWCFQLLCFSLAGWLLYRQLLPSPQWRLTACLGFAAFYPVLSTFWNGQLAALLLLIFVVGLALRQRGRLILAGLVLSLLGLKPQLAVGLVIWLLLRRDWKVILGLCLGGLIQLALTAAALGYEVILAYLHNFQIIGKWFQLFAFSPDHQHAFAGTLSHWLPPDYRRWADFIHLGLDAIAAGFLFRAVRHRATAPHAELAIGMLFTIFVIPHLLTYDLVYLLIPVTALLSQLRSNPAYLLPITLIYASATLAPLYALLGFSLVPLALLIAIYLLAKCTDPEIPSATQT